MSWARGTHLVTATLVQGVKFPTVNGLNQLLALEMGDGMLAFEVKRGGEKPCVRKALRKKTHREPRSLRGQRQLVPVTVRRLTATTRTFQTTKIVTHGATRWSQNYTGVWTEQVYHSQITRENRRMKLLHEPPRMDVNSSRRGYCTSAPTVIHDETTPNGSNG
jgi:hypothetical protein